jgi:hypothetical protein
LYSELSFDEEELLEQHLAGCAKCRMSLEQEKALHGMLDGAAVAVPAGLLVACRQRLSSELSAQRPVANFWSKIGAWFAGPQVWKPVGALAMLAIGFWGGRAMTTRVGVDGGALPGGAAPVSRVRYVEPDAQGNVQIVFEETRQRILRGRLDEEPVRRMLLAAAKDANDPGLRAETVNILSQRSQTSEVRQALLAALVNDTNAGVRLKALEGLKAYAGDLETRRALVRVLAEDENPGVRTRVIDMLMLEANKPRFDAQMVGTLQELVRREQNGYVRQRCEKALRDVNASAEIF